MIVIVPVDGFSRFQTSVISRDQNLNFSGCPADVILMLKLLLLFAFQVASPGEMACVGSIQEQRVPVDVYIAGVESEGVTTFATPGEILYLNGSGVSFLKPGSTQRVIRPEGKVRDGRTDAAVGIYYKDIGTIRIESVDQESATARVFLSCEGMLKGDLVIPGAPKSAVEFNGELSRDVTPVPRGLSSSILLARDDARQLAAGHFCFIPVGTRDGVKPGDRFTIFRPAPSFNPRDMATAGSGADLSANLKYSIAAGILPARSSSNANRTTIFS